MSVRFGGRGRGHMSRVVSSSFSPLSLFADGSLGAWFDPSDSATRFQENTGLTATTTAGQTIGLLLDKRASLTPGSDVRNLGAVGLTGTATAATYDTATGVGSVTRGASVGNQSFVTWSGNLVANGYYLLTIQNTGSNTLNLRSGNEGGTTILTVAAGVTSTCYIPASAFGLITITANSNGQTATFTLSSMRLIPGSHAAQATVANRPFYQTGPQRVDYDATDILTAVVPNLGTNATVARAVPSVGASFLTGQTIAAGNYNDSTDHCGLILINRALTAGETAQLTAWLNAKAGV